MTLEELGKRLTPVPPGDYLIGLSGGADSICLLHLLLPMVREGRLHLTAVHVNHGMRGEESDEDAAFCGRICRAENIPLQTYRLSLAPGTDENTARTERYACFGKSVQATGAQGVILAHHRDDLAETFLMHLLRGSGPEGLGCMQESGRTLGVNTFRPMLRIGRREIRACLAEEGIPWREDSTNSREEYLRNRVRIRILQEMESISPGAAARIARTAGLLAGENRILQDEADAWLAGHSGEHWLDAGALEQLPEAMQKRILRLWWRNERPEMRERELNAAQTEALTDLVKSGGKPVNLPKGLRAVRSSGTLHLTGFLPPQVTEKPWTEPETALGQVILSAAPSGGNPGDGRFSQEVPSGWAIGCTLRFRQPGDRIRPFGGKGSRKLQDYLTDRKVDAPWRDRIPLLCRGKDVLLVAGIGAGAVPEWHPDGQNIRLIWSGSMPWTSITANKELQNGKDV